MIPYSLRAGGRSRRRGATSGDARDERTPALRRRDSHLPGGRVRAGSLRGRGGHCRDRNQSRGVGIRCGMGHRLPQPHPELRNARGRASPLVRAARLARRARRAHRTHQARDGRRHAPLSESGGPGQAGGNPRSLQRRAPAAGARAGRLPRRVRERPGRPAPGASRTHDGRASRGPASPAQRAGRALELRGRLREGEGSAHAPASRDSSRCPSICRVATMPHMHASRGTDTG